MVARTMAQKAGADVPKGWKLCPDPPAPQPTPQKKLGLVEILALLTAKHVRPAPGLLQLASGAVAAVAGLLAHPKSIGSPAGHAGPSASLSGAGLQRQPLQTQAGPSASLSGAGLQRQPLQPKAGPSVSLYGAGLQAQPLQPQAGPSASLSGQGVAPQDVNRRLKRPTPEPPQHSAPKTKVRG